VGGRLQLGGAPLLPCVRSLGFVTMPRGWWGMRNIFIFGRICGLVGCPLDIDLVDCMSC